MQASRFYRYSPLLTGVALLAAVVALQYAGADLQAEPAVSGTPTFAIRNPIDSHVLAKLNSEKIEPSMPCTDEDFVRRVSLDLNGAIPTLTDVKTFLGDHSPNKREKLVEHLLQNERFGDHWAAMWGDLLREHSNSRPQEGTERGSYRNWIQDALNKNMPYDVFAKSLIDAVGNADDDAAVNFYLRDENSRIETANNISTVFMGTRMACAQCHDHPFDKWTQNDFHGLMAFFGRTNVNIDGYATLVRVDKNKRLPESAKPILEPYIKEAKEKLAEEKAHYKKGLIAAEDGGAPTGMMGGMMEQLGMLARGGKLLKELEAKLPPAEMQQMRLMLLNNGVRKVSERPNGEYRMPTDGDGQNKKAKGGEVVVPVFPWDPAQKTEGRGSRRTVLANYVAGSRQFAAVQANRIWASLFGKGIVDPVDDFRAKNPASNPELLDYLTDEFINSKFDNKHLIALIINSSTYQRSSLPTTTNRSDSTFFSHARVRRMSAEQMFDSILVATGRTSGLTEGAGYSLGMGREMMEDKFKGMYLGQKSMPVQWAVDLPTPAKTGTFMNAFNQPTREETTCKRDESGSIPQALEMLNGATLNGAIKSSSILKQIVEAKLSPQQAAQELFLATLSRRPSSGELNSVCSRVNAVKDYKEWVEDVYWALFNTREFTFVK